MQTIPMFIHYVTLPRPEIEQIKDGKTKRREKRALKRKNNLPFIW